MRACQLLLMLTSGFLPCPGRRPWVKFLLVPLASVFPRVSQGREWEMPVLEAPVPSGNKLAEIPKKILLV